MHTHYFVIILTEFDIRKDVSTDAHLTFKARVPISETKASKLGYPFARIGYYHTRESWAWPLSRTMKCNVPKKTPILPSSDDGYLSMTIFGFRCVCVCFFGKKVLNFTCRNALHARPIMSLLTALIPISTSERLGFSTGQVIMTWNS